MFVGLPILRRSAVCWRPKLRDQIWLRSLGWCHLGWDVTAKIIEVLYFLGFKIIEVLYFLGFKIIEVLYFLGFKIIEVLYFLGFKIIEVLYFLDFLYSYVPRAFVFNLQHLEIVRTDHELNTSCRLVTSVFILHVFLRMWKEGDSFAQLQSSSRAVKTLYQSPWLVFIPKSTTMCKGTGQITQPCLTLVLTRNHSLCWPSYRARH